jgi:hypothetical protein
LFWNLEEEDSGAPKIVNNGEYSPDLDASSRHVQSFSKSVALFSRWESSASIGLVENLELMGVSTLPLFLDGRVLG